jgi:hypothetical protein
MFSVLTEKDVKYIFALVEKKATKRGLTAVHINNNSQLLVRKRPDSSSMVITKTIKCDGFDVAYRVLFNVSGVCSEVELTPKELDNVEGFIEKAFEALQRDIDRRVEIDEAREREARELNMLKTLIPEKLRNRLSIFKNSGSTFDLQIPTLTYAQVEKILQAF